MKTGGEKKQTIKSFHQEILMLKDQLKEKEPLQQKVIELQETVKILNNDKNVNEETSAKIEINCTTCGISFNSKGKLKKHNIEKHSQRINCHNCDKVFMKNCEL